MLNVIKEVQAKCYEKKRNNFRLREMGVTFEWDFEVWVRF